MKLKHADLLRLLQAMAAELRVEARLLVIDFPVYSLAYYPGPGIEEVPVDVAEKIHVAHTIAHGKTRILIPFQTVPISNFPFLFETRLTPLQVTGLGKIKVDVLDRHDAFVTCIIQGDRRQISSIQSSGIGSGLNYEGLLESFCSIDPSNGDINRIRQDFLNLIEALFGSVSLRHAEATIAERMG